ncbi:MAG: hypothetical protein ABSG53_02725 [Thermoguttaceae bacterium]
MRKKVRFTLISLAVLGLIAAAVVAIYHASQQVPAFYSEAISVPAVSQEKESDLMLQQITTLHNELQEKGTWRQVFKAQTINGWLAVDLPQNHPTLLPKGMHDPRVHIGPQGITMACRVDRGGLHVVVSLQVSAFVESDNVVGLRVHKARLGAIPWSLRSVLDGITDAAQQSNVDIRWRQSDSDPVALIKLTSFKGGQKQIIHIDTIRLEEGALVVAGTTEIAN